MNTVQGQGTNIHKKIYNKKKDKAHSASVRTVSVRRKILQRIGTMKHQNFKYKHELKAFIASRSIVRSLMELTSYTRIRQRQFAQVPSNS